MKEEVIFRCEDCHNKETVTKGDEPKTFGTKFHSWLGHEPVCKKCDSEYVETEVWEIAEQPPEVQHE